MVPLFVEEESLYTTNTHFLLHCFLIAAHHLFFLLSVIYTQSQGMWPVQNYESVLHTISSEIGQSTFTIVPSCSSHAKRIYLVSIAYSQHVHNTITLQHTTNTVRVWQVGINWKLVWWSSSVRLCVSVWEIPFLESNSLFPGHLLWRSNSAQHTTHISHTEPVCAHTKNFT